MDGTCSAIWPLYIDSPRRCWGPRWSGRTAAVCWPAAPGRPGGRPRGRDWSTCTWAGSGAASAWWRRLAGSCCWCSGTTPVYSRVCPPLRSPPHSCRTRGHTHTGPPSRRLRARNCSGVVGRLRRHPTTPLGAAAGRVLMNTVFYRRCMSPSPRVRDQ